MSRDSHAVNTFRATNRAAAYKITSTEAEARHHAVQRRWQTTTMMSAPPTGSWGRRMSRQP